MLAVGFDPSFIDTLVRVNNENGTLAHSLPDPGHHHRDSFITRIAGGNGVNISAILTKIGIDHVLVAPCNQEFLILLKRRHIERIEMIECEINETVGLTWSPGEIQFNYGRHGLSKKHWTSKVHDLWTNSFIQTYLNWGLNPTSLEWVSVQWLATCGWTFEEISETKNPISAALNATSPNNSIIVEPGSIRLHKNKDELMKILIHISEESQGLQFAIFSSNEEEYNEYSKVKMKQCIMHTSSYVEYKTEKDMQTYQVEGLLKEPKTFVGAGDAFLAGIIKSINDDNLDINQGIDTARNFLLDEL
ncbi:MAG: hypothetical protein ACW99A_20415 [Candidatus Kariarchaeaceae archaeon]|jgi:hypothetical protein